MSARPRTRAALTIFAPVRRATSPQYAGPSSPCSWTIVRPSAHAPASTARLASSRPVMPQILMRGARGVVTPASYGLWRPGGLRRARREGDLDGALLAVAD